MSDYDINYIYRRLEKLEENAFEFDMKVHRNFLRIHMIGIFIICLFLEFIIFKFAY